MEDFDLTGAGEFGEVDGASAADAGGGRVVGGDRGKLRQELARMDEEVFDCWLAGKSRFPTGLSARFGMTRVRSAFLDLSLALELSLDFFDGAGLADFEFGDRGAAEGFEMGSAAEAQADLVGDRAHVGSGGDAGAEVGAVGFERGDEEFFNLDLNRLQDYLFLFSGQLVGGDPVDFLGGKRRGGLLDKAKKSGG